MDPDSKALVIGIVVLIALALIALLSYYAYYYSTLKSATSSQCSLPVEKRSCTGLNILTINGQKVLCPPHFTIKSTTAGSVCALANSQTGTQCSDWPGGDSNATKCNPINYNIPCYGAWPQKSTTLVGFENLKTPAAGGTAQVGTDFQTDPLAASQVCGN